METIRKIRIELWNIEDNTTLYANNSSKLKWPRRNTNVIDKIVIGATDVSSWDAVDLADFDTSEKNNVTPGKELPGIGCHFFVSAASVIEKVSEYENIIYHTPSINSRSLSVMIQYTITNNNSAPSKKIIQSLERLLTILCMEFKLNPYKAILGQREVLFRNIPFIKGRKKLVNISPGLLLDLDHLRRQVAVKIQMKLRYAGAYNGPVTGKFDRATKRALNVFHSDVLAYLYKGLNEKSLGKAK